MGLMARAGQRSSVLVHILPPLQEALSLALDWLLDSFSRLDLPSQRDFRLLVGRSMTLITAALMC